MPTKRKAIITGITGQDGAWLAELLLTKGYEVHGIRRRASQFNTSRIDHLLHDSHVTGYDLTLHYGDLTDSSSLIRIVQEIQPDEVYNLAAQSHVAISFQQPEFTGNVNALGALRLLEAIRIGDREGKARFYQASTSELYGLTQQTQQDEHTAFHPRSPYAAAKLYAYWITVNYREAYDMYACNGILFNHESSVRGEIFVTRKITRALARISTGLQSRLYLGNLNAVRDWGHARDYVRAMWLMLQQDEPDDYVIATGEHHSVREFVDIAARTLGMHLRWQGHGVDEKAYDERTGSCVVEVDRRYFRPAEGDTLLGDASKARARLGWVPETSFSDLVREMVAHDLEEAERDRLIISSGFRYYNPAG